MRFDLTPEQVAWRDEVRSFLAEHFTPEVRNEYWERGPEEPGPHVAEFQKKVGEKGWWGLNWPKEYGGLDKKAVEKLLYTEEFEYVGAPSPSLTVTSIGPTILHVGTEENKKAWIPKIISGEAEFAIGYSEPDAGTDLASLKTRAELHGDEWVINGQKIWNSLAHFATHNWLAARTDPDLPKHKGISVIVVPMDAPGITVEPLWTWPGVRTNLTFFEDVRVPKENLIGELNQGWYYIIGALAFERVGLSSAGQFRRILDELAEFCRSTVVDGEVLAQRPEVRMRLAELETDYEVARLLNYRTAAMVDAGKIPFAEGAMMKVFTSELRTKVGDWGMQILELFGQLRGDDELAPLRGRVEQLYRVAPLLRFGGGANEVQRDIIAQRGFGLPR